MTFLGRIADSWDAQRRQTMEILGNWVTETTGGEQVFAIVVAGSLQTAMDLGQGFVDVLRIGQGVQQGTLAGIGHDGLRLLSLLGPAGRAVRMSSRVISRFIPIVADTSPTAGICTWVGGANALRATGIRHAVTAADVMSVAAADAAVAQRAATQAAIHIPEIIPTLQAMGARPIVTSGVNSLAQLMTVTRQMASRGGILGQGQRGGVTMFSVYWHSTRAQATVGHTMVAYLDTLGRFRILDRTGRVFSSLTEMESLYPGISTASSWGNVVAHIPEAIALRLASGASILHVIGFEVNSVLISGQQPSQATAAHQ